MNRFLSITIYFLLASLQSYAQNKENVSVKLEEFNFKNTSIRAIEIVNDSTVWFAGSNGRFGRIINGKIQLDSISYDDKLLNFRSIAFNGKNIFILSIENPAVLYRIDPFDEEIIKPEVVYQESHPNIFYDSMTFFDSKNGIAMGDPVDKCLSVILTKDGGNTWQKLDCNNLPDMVKDEAAFAASNTNLSIYGKNAWMVTGGKKARVFYTNNYGEKWKVAETPITKGGKMTGIYSVDFYDKNYGIIMGGNWEEKSDTQKTKAITTDGGRSWKLIANQQIPGYISCVQYVPYTQGREIIAVSSEGIYFSQNKGNSWKKISDKGFYSIRFIDKETAWLSGNNIIAKMQLQ